MDASSRSKHGFAERGLRRQPDEAASLHRLLAAVPVQDLHLPFAHAGDHEKTLVPLEVGVDVEMGLALDLLRLERAPHRNDAEHAGPRREDPLASALNHELLEELGKLLVQQPHVGFVPADQERAQPVLLLALDL